MATKEMVGHIVKFAFHVGDYCPGETEMAQQIRSGNSTAYVRELIRAANGDDEAGYDDEYDEFYDEDGEWIGGDY